jgi:hypothetical protein
MAHSALRTAALALAALASAGTSRAASSPPSLDATTAFPLG